MRRETILLALVFILVGTYFLLIELELGVPELDRLWPVFLFSWGMFLLVNCVRTSREDVGPIFWGTGLTLSSIFLFLISLGDQDYSVLKVWWPVFIVIAGISFLAFGIAQRFQDWGVLFLAVVGMLFGGVALLFNLQFISSGIAREMSKLWPAFPIVIGLILLLKNLRSRPDHSS
jgi:hypothetical protein